MTYKVFVNSIAAVIAITGIGFSAVIFSAPVRAVELPVTPRIIFPTNGKQYNSNTNDSGSVARVNDIYVSLQNDGTKHYRLELSCLTCTAREDSGNQVQMLDVFSTISQLWISKDGQYQLRAQAMDDETGQMSAWTEPVRFVFKRFVPTTKRVRFTHVQTISLEDNGIGFDVQLSAPAYLHTYMRLNPKDRWQKFSYSTIAQTDTFSADSYGALSNALPGVYYKLEAKDKKGRVLASFTGYHKFVK